MDVKLSGAQRCALDLQDFTPFSLAEAATMRLGAFGSNRNRQEFDQ
jgi:hypothetical protein